MISFYGGPSVEAGLAAIARARAAGMKARPRQPAVRVEGVPSVAEWRQRPDWSAGVDDEMRRKFVAAILPKLAAVRPSDIARTIGVTPNHAIRIRLGRIVPHPRFHTKLATLLS